MMSLTAAAAEQADTSSPNTCSLERHGVADSSGAKARFPRARSFSAIFSRYGGEDRKLMEQHTSAMVICRGQRSTTRRRRVVNRWASAALALYSQDAVQHAQPPLRSRFGCDKTSKQGLSLLEMSQAGLSHTCYVQCIGMAANEFLVGKNRLAVFQYLL